MGSSGTCPVFEVTPAGCLKQREEWTVSSATQKHATNFCFPDRPGSQFREMGRHTCKF